MKDFNINDYVRIVKGNGIADDISNTFVGRFAYINHIEGGTAEIQVCNTDIEFCIPLESLEKINESQTIYELEVGVHLNKNNEEYESYAISGTTPTTELGYYNENNLSYLEYAKAKEYADEYVKRGVNNTYAFITSDIYNLDDIDIESVENNAYFEHDINIPNISEWLYYTYKDENGNIKTIINKGE